MDYKFKTEPYAHQLTAFNLCKNVDQFALLMEQGTGKTKVAIDKACYGYCEGKINAVLIVAPNGVHANWIHNELGKHVPAYITYNAVLWGKTKGFKIAFDLSLPDPALLFFAINIDALATDAGKQIVRRFLTLRKTLMILDESSRIKTASAIRTKTAINFGKFAQERLIMTGTPITQSPFDLYSQFKFLDSNILGNQTFTAFKHEYGVFDKKVNYKTGYPYEVLQEYRNLNKLQTLIAPYSYRVTKDECLDLPAKIYQRYVVDLTPTQRRHYNELRDHLCTEIKGHEIVTPIILTKFLRLQQITGGFITLAEEETATAIPGENPKLNLLVDLLEDISGKVIIWARFTAEIKALVKALTEKYGRDAVVQYWGEIPQEERHAAVTDFQDRDNTRFFVGNARAGGIGLTLTAATTMIYFSNDFSLETRLQSEDRAHRIGQKNNVTYIDLEADNTLDAKVIDALRNKKNIADLITGDNVKEWL